MSNQNGYIGRSPGDSAVIIASQTFEPTGIQTDFTFASGYDPGYIDVYFNGARLVYANDYTATNGSTVGLTTYANNGDVLELVAYKAFNVGNVETAGGNFSVGNQLTVVGATTATTAYYTGVVTATSFSGDGSSLTGISVGITTEASTATDGTTVVLNLAKDDHKVLASGVVTIDVTGGTEADSHVIRVENTGIATVGFATHFQFPSGGTPNLPTASGSISLISFTVHKTGAAGTTLLAGASVNFS